MNCSAIFISVFALFDNVTIDLFPVETSIILLSGVGGSVALLPELVHFIVSRIMTDKPVSD